MRDSKPMEIFKKEPHVDFMGKIRTAMMFSGLLILASLISLAVHGGLKFGIDFAGGTLVQLKFESPPRMSDIRDGLKSIGLEDSTLQEFGSPNHILIRVERSQGALEEMGSTIKEALGKKMNPDTITVGRAGPPPRSAARRSCTSWTGTCRRRARAAAAWCW